jgi:hypothetical protein
MTIFRLLLVAMMCSISIADHPAPTPKALTFNFTGSAAAQVIQVTLDPDGRIVLGLNGHHYAHTHRAEHGGGVLPDIEATEEDVSTRTLVWIVLGLVLLLGVCTALPSRHSSSSPPPRHYLPDWLTIHGSGGCD